MTPAHSTYTPNPIDGWALDVPRPEPVRDALVTAAATHVMYRHRGRQPVLIVVTIPDEDERIAA